MHNILPVGQLNYSTEVQKSAKSEKRAEICNAATNPISGKSHPTFRSNIPQNFRTELVTAAEIKKFTEISKDLSKVDKKLLEFLLKTGTLLNDKSNDKTSVLDNLYKISTIQRAQGLSSKDILSSTIDTLANPYTITQKFGDIPQNYREQALNADKPSNLLERFKDKTTNTEIDVDNSGVCVAASIEFNLANKQPAEFARLAENLSSPELSSKKTIRLRSLTDNTLDSVWLLNSFEIPYKLDNADNAILKFAPDKNAILRAQIQTSNRDEGERSALDVLMQSTFMNIGSQHSYNTISDKRAGKFNQNDKGLIEFEKTFTETIVEDKCKTSVTYQKIDDNGKLVGYETDFQTMKKQITDTLKTGENVIVGYVMVDKDNTVINGHEITIVGVQTDKNGKDYFVCNDTDDNISEPIIYSEDYLLPKIHHAGLPEAIAEESVSKTQNWVEGLNNYKNLKSTN